MNIQKAKYEEEFEKYASRYDSSNPNIALKIKHMYEVEKIAYEIALRLNLGKEDREKAKFLGLYHDIGRFEQLSRFNTYDDSISIDHGDFGAEILLEGEYIKEVMPGLTDEEYDILIMAVKYHNKLKLPDALPNGNHYLCRIIRDADKIDIYRSMSEESVSDIFFDLTEEDCIISDEVEKAFYECQPISRKIVKTKADELVLTIAFSFDFNYHVSNDILLRKGYLKQFVSAFLNCKMVKKSNISSKILTLYDYLNEHLRNN